MTDPERTVSLRWEYLGELVKRKRADNPKEHATEAILDSIRTVGFIDPVIINARDGRVLAGHGRLDALISMRDAGESAPMGIQVENPKVWLVPVLEGVDLDEDQAARYVVAANRTTEIGGWNDQRLEAMLAHLAETETGLLGTGYEDDDLAKLRRNLAKPEKLPTDGDEAAQYRCPHCSTTWSGARQPPLEPGARRRRPKQATPDE